MELSWQAREGELACSDHNDSRRNFLQLQQHQLTTALTLAERNIVQQWQGQRHCKY
jgi:hypothetical protein